MSAMLDPNALAREWNAERAARAAWVNAASDLAVAIGSGAAEPEQEAARAAAQGRWSLMTRSTATPFGIHYAIGVECRPNLWLFLQSRLQLLHGQPSDVIRGAEDMEQEGRYLERFYHFAQRYNHTLISHPAFPFRDLCRPAPADYRPSHYENFASEQWGFRDLRETDRPIDLYEAARRGSLASLRRLTAERPRQIHIPDVLDMTPLAWAVRYDRPQHAQLLLQAGAHPYGGPWQNYPSERSPITIALEERNRGIIALMTPVLERLGLPLPATPPALDVRRSRLSQMLPEQGSYGPPLLYLLGARFDVSADGHVVECAFSSAVQVPHAALCDRARRWLRFIPAEDSEGRPVSGSIYMRHLPISHLADR